MTVDSFLWPFEHRALNLTWSGRGLKCKLNWRREKTVECCLNSAKLLECLNVANNSQFHLCSDWGYNKKKGNSPI